MYRSFGLKRDYEMTGLSGWLRGRRVGLVLAVLGAWAAVSDPRVVRGQEASGPPEAAASDRTTGSLETQVLRLVRDLAHDEPQVRTMAEQELLTLGPEALPFLPQSGPRTTEDLRLRLRRIRQQLEQARAEMQTRATRVTLDRPLSLVDALAAITEQTGNRLLDYRDRLGGTPDETVHAWDLRDLPFWEALTAVLQKTDSKIYIYSGETNALAIVPRLPKDHETRFFVHEGVFRVELLRLIAIRDLLDGQADGLRLEFAVLWEPRLNPLLVQHPLQDWVVRDDLGESLLPEERKAMSLESPVEPGVGSVEFEVPLRLPSRDAKAIARIEGDLTAQIPGPVVEFVFEDAAAVKNKVLRQSGVSVELEGATIRDQLLDVRLKVVYETGGEAFESHRGWMFSNPAFLRHEEEIVEPIAYETLYQRGTEFAMAFKFDVAEIQEYQFVYQTPSTVVTVPIRFQMEGVSLP